VRSRTKKPRHAGAKLHFADFSGRSTNAQPMIASGVGGSHKARRHQQEEPMLGDHP
jgi:hypothetical protein